MLSTTFAANLAASSHGTLPITLTTYDIDNPSLNTSNTGGGTSQSIDIYFFYGNGCPHCAIVEPLIDSLAAKYPQINIEKLEVYYNSTNQALFQDFNYRYGIKDPVVPEAYIGDKVLVGDDAIKNSLESEIQRIISTNTSADNNNNSTSDNASNENAPNGTSDNASNGNPNYPINPLNYNNNGSGGTNSPSHLTIAMVIVASVADSLNPCALSVMIFLLLFLTGLGDTKRVLKVGIVYIVTVYLVYFVTGLGAMTFLQSSAMTRNIYYLAASLSIIIGIVNIKDYFFFGKGPTLAIPESRKPTIKKYIEKASIPAAIVLGFTVSLFELPCTGGIYLAILSLLGNKMTVAEGMPYLALYNIIFVLPLIVILAIIYKGASAQKMNSWRLDKRRTLRLGIGVVMVLLGVVMLFGAL